VVDREKIARHWKKMIKEDDRDDWIIDTKWCCVMWFALDFFASVYRKK
jgi:hypothetical protein